MGIIWNSQMQSVSEIPSFRIINQLTRVLTVILERMQANWDNFAYVTLLLYCALVPLLYWCVPLALWSNENWNAVRLSGIASKCEDGARKTIVCERAIGRQLGRDNSDAKWTEERDKSAREPNIESPLKKRDLYWIPCNTVAGCDKLPLDCVGVWTQTKPFQEGRIQRGGGSCV
jgi:hypothetical protein